MNVTGIIAEYNPFHNGHAYQIDVARETTNADFIVVVMSGNFVQRGTPAIFDKYTRAKMALANGADLVIELPLYYACGSAELFARGGVTLLHKLGITNNLSFGSELGSCICLTQIASLLVTESPKYQTLLRTSLKEGISYPAARKQALIQLYPDKAELLSCMDSPNNILGIEYCKALLSLNSTITPVTIKREGNDYHDVNLTKQINSDSDIIDNLDKSRILSSASAIRSSLGTQNKILEKDSLTYLKKHMPESAHAIFTNAYGQKGPIEPNDVSQILHYKLLSEKNIGYSDYLDCTEDLSDRIVNELNRYKNFQQFVDILKTKELTYTRISRVLTHILLDITKKQAELFAESGGPQYIRILGFKESATTLLRGIKDAASIPMLSKLADSYKLLSSAGMQMLSCDVTASHIYNMIIEEKYKTTLSPEYSTPIIKY